MLRIADKTKWLGKGVLKAISNINTNIAPKVVAKNLDPVNQKVILFADQAMCVQCAYMRHSYKFFQPCQVST